MTQIDGTVRVQYSKIENGSMCFVIVDRRENEPAEFWAQEAGEVRWWRFAPEPAEESAALALFEKGSAGGKDWPLLLRGQLDRREAANCSSKAVGSV